MYRKSITLFLMTEKGFEFLKRTYDRYHSLYEVVVIGNDSKLQNDFEVELIKFCHDHRLNYIKRAEFISVETEYVIAISWRWLIDYDQNKLIIFHDSLLPKYRGFAPLVNSLINGEREIGVSAIFGAKNFDSGPIISQSTTKIKYPIKIHEAIQLIVDNYVSCAEIILNSLLMGRPLKGVPQVEANASYSVWRDELDYKIDWMKSAEEIKRLIDAVGYPYSGAYTILDGERVRVLDAVVEQDIKIENRCIGKVMFIESGYPVVICGQGMLKITAATIENGKEPQSLLPLTKYRLRFAN